MCISIGWVDFLAKRTTVASTMESWRPAVSKSEKPELSKINLF